MRGGYEPPGDSTAVRTACASALPTRFVKRGSGTALAVCRGHVASTDCAAVVSTATFTFCHNQGPLCLRQVSSLLPYVLYGNHEFACQAQEVWLSPNFPNSIGGQMPSLLGTKINELRRERALTLEQLAHATDSSKSYMWEIENKDVARPSAEKLERIASALGVTSAFLMDASQVKPTEDVEDTAFFHRFQKADPDVKEKLKRILDVLDNED